MNDKCPLYSLLTQVESVVAAGGRIDRGQGCAMNLSVLEQPKLVCLPASQRGETEFPGIASRRHAKAWTPNADRGRGARPRVTVAKVTFKTEPVS
jgi:hypothetical protein